jgi:hypothetical protein
MPRLDGELATNGFGEFRGTMKRFVVPVVELGGLIAAIYFGMQWLRHPSSNFEAAFALSGVITLLAEWFRRHLSTGVDANAVSAFIEEGRRLMSRQMESPLPVQDHNEWVERMDSYFRKLGRHDFAVRLGDFSGFTFYGDGSERSRYSMGIDGRLRRLHEFLRELSQKENGAR